MFDKYTPKKTFKPVLDDKQHLVTELNEENQELISGGLQRLQEEFAAELAVLLAIDLPSLLAQTNKAK